MTFKKILCPIDFSPGSQQAMRTAVRLANEDGAELVLFHAWHIPALVLAGEGFPPLLGESLAEDAQRGLDDAAREATQSGAKQVTTKLASGLPWAQIVELLEREPFDLAVIGTHGRTGLSRILLGSVAEKVVRHAPCSVLAVHPHDEPAPYTHALCPVDFTPSSRHAIDLATSLVRPGGAGITLLHVLEIPVAYSGEVMITDFARDLDGRAARQLDQWAASARTKVTVSIATKTRIGYAGAQVLSAIDHDRTIDLVVVGSHGRTGVKRALLGSVAEKVVRHARCPVLVARERD
jgi:nucleotide-binding universal stress UspA family protein